MKYLFLARGVHLENHAVSVGAALRSGTIQVSVVIANHAVLWKEAVCAVSQLAEAVYYGNLVSLVNFVNASAAVHPVVDGSIKNAFMANHSRGWIATIFQGSIEAIQNGFIAGRV